MAPTSRRKKIVNWTVCLLSLAAVAGTVAWFLWPKQLPPLPPFNGSSELLQHTVIVPTLDSPIPEGKSVIWCIAMQLAWNRLRQDIVHGPVLVKGAEALAERLNQAGPTEDDLAPGSFYAAAGLVRHRIVDRIKREMQEQFPAATMPALASTSDDVAVAFGYLAAGVAFPQPFVDDLMTFKDATRKESKLDAFGLRHKDEGLHEAIRNSIAVLYSNGTYESDWHGDEFVLDLCKTSSPNQVLVSRCPRKTTLAETLVDMERKITALAQVPEEKRPKQPWFGVTDMLLVPEMHWRIDHRFRELEGRDKVLLSSGLSGIYLHEARQIIQFDLDRGGARVEAQAPIRFKGIPREYHFDRPFLIILKKRDAKHPFFVMWVDNAELMSRR